MKKIHLYTAFTLCIITAISASAQNCCPEFSLQFKKEDCHGQPCINANGQGAENLASMCRNGMYSFFVAPNNVGPGFTYAWTISGGTPSSASGNPVNITWGNGQTGSITVVITSADGKCVREIKQDICLRDAPSASFTFNPNNSCAGTPINFTNTSIGGLSVNWDFGDLTSSNSNNPIHTYTAAGTYTVTLTVSNDTGNCTSPLKPCCACTSTYTQTVTVIQGTPVLIIPQNCPKACLCPGDTAEYCSSVPCSTYTWTVQGGHIITANPSASQCIKVIWDNPGVYPTGLTLNVPNCGGTCGSVASLNVPVLFPNIPIIGNLSVCMGSNELYSLPSIPGAFYTWTLNGGGSITGASVNTANIGIHWSNPGVYQLNCNYTNPLTGCSGSSSISVTVKPVFAINGYPLQVCEGCTANFFTSDGSVASWSANPATGISFSPVTAANTIASFSIAGSYTVTGLASSSNYCNTAASLQVVVAPKPALTAPSFAPACPGSIAQYYVQSTQTNMPVQWSVTNGGTVISTSGDFDDTAYIQAPASGGTFTITATQDCKFQCLGGQASVTIPVNIIPAPGMPTGPTSVCMDASSTYSLPAGNYTWSVSPSNAGTITGGQGTNAIQVLWQGSTSAASNTATITATNICGTQGPPLSVTIHTPAIVSITQSGNLCNPGIQLNATAGLTGYSWFSPTGNSFTPTTTSSLLVTTPGDYGFSATNSFGCVVKSVTHVLRTFYPGAYISTADPTTYCVGDPIHSVLSAQVAVSGTYTYSWLFNGTATSGVTSSYTATQAGNYQVIVSMGNCKDTSNVLTIATVNCLPACFEPGKNHMNGLNDLAYNKTYQHGPNDNIYRYYQSPDAISDTTAKENAEKYFYNPPSPNGSITILNKPINYCNNPVFNANYCVNVATSSFYAGINWYFGDGNSTTVLPPYPYVSAGNCGNGNPVTHNYLHVGSYLVMAEVILSCTNPPPTHYCRYVDTTTVVVPLAANFGTDVHCGTVTLTNLSEAATNCVNGSGVGGSFSSQWNVINAPGSPAITGSNGVFSSSSTAVSPILSFTQSGTYYVTLAVNSSVCSCTKSITKTVVISLPIAAFTVTSPICTGTPISPNISTAAVNSYQWMFGDSYTSSLGYPVLPSHTYMNAGTYNMTLTVTDGSGCTSTSSQPVMVSAKPTLSVNSPTPVCPGSAAILTATFSGNMPCGNSTATYQWYKDGNSISNATSVSYTASQFGTYWVVANCANGGCRVESNHVTLIIKSTPHVKIKGQSIVCMSGGNGYITLSSEYNPNYSYSWSANSTAVTFSPANSNTTYISVNTTGDYSIYLQVTDNTTGCIKRDTLCIFARTSPTVSITQPAGNLCAGNNYTLTATPLPATAPPSGYSYLWSNGANVPSINVNATGSYSITLTDLNTGCVATATPVIIHALPDVSLFPTCCDTICDTSHINVPLPLAAGESMSDEYTSIQWFEGSTLIYTGYSLPGIVLSLGTHTIHIVVTNIFGCTSTSGDLTVTVKHCGPECDCSGSHWGAMTYVTHRGNGTIVCGETTLMTACDPVTINASFGCNENCNGSNVTATLFDQSGNIVQTWASLPLTYTPASGTASNGYVFVLYGHCGTHICDSCKIILRVDCEIITPPCNICDSSMANAIHINTVSQNLSSQTISINNYNLLSQNVSISTGSFAVTEVKAEVVSLNLNPSYADCYSCNNKPFAWGSIAANSLAGIVPVTSGATPSSGYNVLSNLYANPKEVVWTFTNPATLNNVSTNLNIYLPGLISVPCCKLSGSVCIKFTFRDNNCKVCERVVCFAINQQPDCACGRWGTTTATNISTGTVSKSMNVSIPNVTLLSCGANYSTVPGNRYNFTMSYSCSGNDCSPVYNWRLLDAGNNVVQSGTSSTAIITMPVTRGGYRLELHATCGGLQCDPCTINLLNGIGIIDDHGNNGTPR